ncbi:hypothetical protein RRG08_012239 [Elysia crispata]|uniref:Uncharacterized protein n=1 Tax=Elysia crispata TaxID=231223 RepID=A0AAE0YPF6_9GAST|nr:hypothetical protein RRG08_012239 [Elysia crispata]
MFGKRDPESDRKQHTVRDKYRKKRSENKVKSRRERKRDINSQSFTQKTNIVLENSVFPQPNVPGLVELNQLVPS